MLPLSPFSQKPSQPNSYTDYHLNVPPPPSVNTRQYGSLPLRYHSIEPNFETGPQKKQQKQQFLQNKSFLDNFDNNNSNLLNQDKSHARNIRGRLFNQEDPSRQRAKEDKMKAYREELAQQMQADRKRKEKQKKDLQEEEIKRQRLFYQKIKVQAQPKQPIENKDNVYYMKRTKKDKQEKKAKQNNYVEIETAKLPRRAYKNQQSLSNSRNRDDLEEQKITEKSIEQQRIAKIHMFQEHMLKKLDFMKVQIRNTSSHLEVDKQLERVKIKLRNNPIQFNRYENSKLAKPELTFNDFFSLPKRNMVKAPKVNVKLEGISKRSRQVQRKNKTVLEEKNDKNFEYVPEEQEQENPQEVAED